MLNRIADVIGSRDIAGRKNRATAGAMNFTGDCLATLRLNIGQADGGAFFRKQSSDSFTDAGGSAADPGHLVLKSIAHGPAESGLSRS
jgi:hypothetical protein